MAADEASTPFPSRRASRGSQRLADVGKESLDICADGSNRGDASHGTDGTGLGLSIVRRGVERSDGTVTLANTGHGLRVILAFAASEPEG